MKARFNFDGQHVSRYGGSNMIPDGMGFYKTFIAKVKHTTASLMDVSPRTLGFWHKRSVTHNSHCSFFNSGFIDICCSPVTSFHQKLNNHNISKQRLCRLLIESLRVVFVRLCIEYRSSLNALTITRHENQPYRFNANADFGCIRLFFEITSSHKAAPVLFATPLFLIKQSHRRHQ